MPAQKPLFVKTTGDLSRFQTSDFVEEIHGGTGAITFAQARINMGLVPGTDIQAYDADLAALAALTTTGIIVRTGVGTAVTRALTAPATGITITNADGVAGAPTLVLANDLAALEALASTGFAVRTAADTWAQRSVDQGVGIAVTNGNGVAGNPTVALATLTDSGTGALLKITRDVYGRVSGTTAALAADITALVDATYVNVAGDSMTGFLTLHADCTSAMHAATKQYVDAVAAGGQAPWLSVRVVSIANLTLSAPQTIDSVAVVAGERVLVTGQSVATENGVYVVAAGAWTRATDADAASEFSAGRFVFVNEGTVFADSGWSFTNNAVPTLGSTSIVFTQTSGLGQIAAAAGLVKTGNSLSVGTASSARIVVNADDIDLATVSDAGTGTFVKITRDAYGRVSGTAAVASADVAPLLDATLTALAGLDTTAGLVVQTGADTFTKRTLTAPAAGFTITNPAGTAGAPTFVLSDDLAAVEALAVTGMIARTAANTWTARAIAGTATRVGVTNGDGVAGAPTIDLLSSGITPGTYNGITYDTYGRATNAVATSSERAVTALTNGEASAIAVGRAVYISAAATARLANANAAGTTQVIGLVQATSINAAASGDIAVSGVVEATTGQWDAVTGQTGGLTFGTRYYLSNTTAGALTTTAPTSGHVSLVGIALSTTKLSLQLGPVVAL